MRVATETTRPKPQEWDDLRKKAEFIANVNLRTLYEDEPGLVELGEIIVGTDANLVKNNAFFAYSSATCGFARYLHNPEARKWIVDRGAFMLLTASSEGVNAFNSQAFALDEVFSPASHAGYEAMARPTQLLGNLLHEVNREGLALGHALPYEVKQARDAVVQQMKGRAEPGVVAALSAIIASPQYILGATLMQRGIDIKNGVVPSVSDIESLRHPSVDHVAVQLCTVTSEQSFGFKGEVISADAEQVKFVKPTQIKPNIFHSIRNGQQVEYDTPFVCPALYVRGVVPLVMGLTIDMLGQASREVV